MKRLLAVTLLLVTGGAAPALADCTDPAGPGVEWRRCYNDGRDFTEANLVGAVLRDTSFARADLSGADLSNADARRAKFFAAKGRRTVFDGADLIEADFSRADLTAASFKGADLRRAEFYRSVLREADFTGARLEGAQFVRADLSGATWTDGTTVCAEGSVGQCN